MSNWKKVDFGCAPPNRRSSGLGFTKGARMQVESRVNRFWVHNAKSAELTVSWLNWVRAGNKIRVNQVAKNSDVWHSSAACRKDQVNEPGQHLLKQPN
jgi:hypothetical protein